MFCSRCGLRVEEGNQFCQSCGQAVGAATAAAVPNAPPVPASMNVSAPRPYAGFWVRFVALVIDGLILAIPQWIVLAIAFSLFGGFALLARMSEMGKTNDPRVVMALFAPLLFVFLIAGLLMMVIQWLYFAGMESSGRQATFGKAAMSLRVTDLEGLRLSFGHATGRYFSKLISGLIPLGIGYIMAGFTAKKQALHDMIAGSLVLRKL
jgi:uncharacterized RDD family membrane protein YckC